MKELDIQSRGLQSMAVVAIVVASMCVAFAASGDTVAWWHFDEKEPGSVATDNTIASGMTPEVYAKPYSLEAHNARTTGDYMPVYARPFHGRCVYDPVSGERRINRSAMKFRTDSNGDTPAYYGGCLLASTGSGQLGSCTGSITVEAFVCTTGGTFSTFAPIIGNLNNYDFMGERWAIYMLADGTLALRFAGNVWYSGDSQVGTAKINDGAWHHIAITWNGSVIKIYVDYEQDKFKSGSVRQFSYTGTIEYASNNSTRIGGYTGSSGNASAQRRFNGLVDEVRISSQVLLPEQFLRMQPIDMDPDEILRISFERGEYGALDSDINIADILGPNCPKALFKTTGGIASFDAADKAGGTVGAGFSSVALENESSLHLTTNGTMTTGSYVQVPSFSGRFVGNPSTNYTIECFYKSGGQIRASHENRQSVFKLGGPTWIASAMLSKEDGSMVVSYRDQVLIDKASQDKHWWDTTDDKALDDGRWHHVAIVVDGDSSVVRTYVDGRVTYCRTGYVPAPDLGYSYSLFIGSGFEGSSVARFFDGWIDSVRVTMRALKPSEFMAANPVGPYNASLFALFEQDYGFVCASNAAFSVTGAGEARASGSAPTFERDSRGPLLVDGLDCPEQTANDWSVSLNASRVVFPPSPLFETDAYTVEFLARFDGIVDENGSVPADSTSLAQHVPIMRLVSGDGVDFDWYVYRRKDVNNAIEMSVNGATPCWSLPGANSRIVDGRWHHYAFAFESTENETRTKITFFRDYVDLGSFTVDRIIPRRVAGHRLMLGEGSYDQPNIVGKFDALRFSRGVLNVLRFMRRVPGGLTIVFR